ncbi:MAG: hypothetical protein A3E85_00210 [Gammaproteobacteria bacterium RIFCSPHIGHO2_12_FULL_45_12]|nr:MAG: hypothetical protein A3E85_00210 [Gammaproteobacteria bacterium RIFCSPHIGHO2_12_FULL_45_12]
MTLLELMVALMLGVLVLQTVLTVYLSVRRHARWQQALSVNVMNAKKVSAILRAEIQQAGYIGCMKLASAVPAAGNAFWSMSAANQLTGSAETLTVRHATLPQSTVLRRLDSFTMEANLSSRFVADDAVILADCQHAAIFQVQSVVRLSQQQKVTARQPLPFWYGAGAEISRLAVNTFWVGATTRVDETGAIIHALYLRDWRGHQEELVDGIERIQFRYVVQQGLQLREVLAHQVTDWSEVKGVAARLVVRQSSLHQDWYLYVSVRH